ncbi:hypothetical protein KVH31_34925 [Streptomyces olivaceus]|uniref:hypothetical protein n=1 Tax=Streptomyces olivaceus TaxID=47716 RepID=UPI001CCBF35D|nr:hypothetical protein [Streptomyces olivaceus]MBZ6211692.1 hypothetical protein [Streptomyces olivaceus]
MTSDQVTVYACRAAAASAFAGGACLTIAGRPLVGVLLLWLVPGLLLVAGRARRAHTRTPYIGRTSR